MQLWYICELLECIKKQTKSIFKWFNDFKCFVTCSFDPICTCIVYLYVYVGICPSKCHLYAMWLSFCWAMLLFKLPVWDSYLFAEASPSAIWLSPFDCVASPPATILLPEWVKELPENTLDYSSCLFPLMSNLWSFLLFWFCEPAWPR